MRSTDAAALIVALVIAWSFVRAHRDKHFTFDLFDLLMEHGKVSRIACAFMATLVVTSWVVVRLTIDGKLSDVIFAAYGTMWVAPIVTRLFSSQAPSTSSTSTLTTSKTSTP